MGRVTVLETPAEVAGAAAERFADAARAAAEERGSFSVVLAGGSTPRHAYQLLAGEGYEGRVDWSKVHVFFGDERCVPHDHAESNYRMANEALLSRVRLPLNNIHRINGVGDAVANARLYEDEMRTYFDGAEWPRFDLVLLGMGEDGHTASLFPGSPALEERAAWAAAKWVEELGANRITLTAPAINHAARILFMVTGGNKAARLAEVLGEGDASQGPAPPARLIEPLDGTLEWLVDKGAAARLF